MVIKVHIVARKSFIMKKGFGFPVRKGTPRCGIDENCMIKPNEYSSK